MEHILVSYESVADFMSAAIGPSPVRNAQGYQYWVRVGVDFDWCGVPGSAGVPGPKLRDAHAQTVIDCVNAGWTEGGTAIETALDNVRAANVASVKRRQTWTDDGDDVSLDRLHNGNLDIAFRRARRASCMAPPRVIVAVDCIASGSVRAKEMFWKGAAAVRLAESLCLSGYNVCLVSGFTGIVGGTSTTLVTVKPAGAHFELATAAAAVAMPGFFRILGHLHGANCLPAGYSNGQGGYNVAPLDSGMVQAMDPGARVFIAHQNISDKTKAQAWMHECVAKLEQPLENAA